MTDELRPDPLVPVDVDLRGYEFMPLFGDRMFTSETWIGASAEEKLAAIRLWWRSFAHELPAASLPDNDQMLAEYAGYGVMVKSWRKVKAQAMRGFVLCNDGRWYHRFLADVVVDCWAQRQVARTKGILGSSKRWANHKHKNSIAGLSEKHATATKKHSKGEERKKDLGGEVTSPTRGSEGQGPLKFSLKSTPPADIEANRERARKLVSGEIKVGR